MLPVKHAIVHSRCVTSELCVHVAGQLFPNDTWDDSLWAEFRKQYDVDPTVPGLNQDLFSSFRQDMAVLEQQRGDLFAEFDEDADGYLDQSEMKVAATSLYPVSSSQTTNPYHFCVVQLILCVCTRT